MAIIEVKDLGKTYGEGNAIVTALNSVNLAIEKGQFVAVMGPSGCGKSTLLHLIGGLDRQTVCGLHPRWENPGRDAGKSRPGLDGNRRFGNEERNGKSYHNIVTPI